MLCRLSFKTEKTAPSLSGRTYLDDSSHKCYYITELAHINIKMSKIILQSFVGDNLASLSHGTKTSQVSGRVELRVGGSGQVDLGKLDGRHWGLGSAW